MTVKLRLPDGTDRTIEGVSAFDADEGALHIFTDEGLQASILIASGHWVCVERVLPESQAN